MGIFKKKIKIKDITLEDLGMKNRGGVYDVNNAYKTVSAVYASVNAIASSIASLPIDSYNVNDAEETEPLKTSQTNELIYGDNDNLIQDIVISLLSFGVAYVRKLRGLTGKIYDLDFIKFNYISKQNDNTYFYSSAKSSFIIPADDLIIFKTPNPYDDGILSPISAAYRMLSANNEARIYQENLFKNGIVSTGILEVDKDYELDSKGEAIAKIRNSFTSNYAGRRNIGKPIIIQGASYKPISLQVKDIQFLELANATAEDVMMIYGVPPIILGRYDNANYKVETQRKLFWENTLLPLIAYLERIFNIEFQNLNEKIKFNTTGVKALQEDIKTQVETGEKLLRMGFTLNQVNEKLNLGFDLGGISWADDYLGSVPLAVDTNVKSIKTKNFMSPDDVKLWSEVDAITKSQEENYAKKISNYFYKIRKEILKKIKPNTVMADVIGNLDWIAKDKELIGLSKPYIQDVFLKSYDKLLREVGIDKQNPYLNQDVIDVIPDRFSTVLMSNRTLKKELMKAVGQGLSVDEMAANIKNVMNISSKRARTIAQTNLVGATNQGRFKAMSDNGIDNITWVSTPDDRTRDTHRAQNGETIKRGETFDNGLKFPGDPSGAPEEIINCRCTIKANIGE